MPDDDDEYDGLLDTPSLHTTHCLPRPALQTTIHVILKIIYIYIHINPAKREGFYIMCKVARGILPLQQGCKALTGDITERSKNQLPGRIAGTTK